MVTTITDKRERKLNNIYSSNKYFSKLEPPTRQCCQRIQRRSPKRWGNTFPASGAWRNPQARPFACASTYGRLLAPNTWTEGTLCKRLLKVSPQFCFFTAHHSPLKRHRFGLFMKSWNCSRHFLTFFNVFRWLMQFLFPYYSLFLTLVFTDVINSTSNTTAVQRHS